MINRAHSVASMARKRPAKTKAPAKRWSQGVTAHSNALDLEKGVFMLGDPKQIAASLKRFDLVQQLVMEELQKA